MPDWWKCNITNKTRYKHILCYYILLLGYSLLTNTETFKYMFWVVHRAGM